MSQHLWVVILAAGDGTRLARLTRILHGDDRPKQFAHILPERTLLQATIDRAATLTPHERIVVIVGARHRQMAIEQLCPYPGVHLVVQPRNRGTAAGVLLPLAYIRARDAHARVVVLPSDHHIPRGDGFADAVARIAPRRSGRLALVGAAAEHAEVEYGWIVAGEGDGPLRPVRAFVEKPNALTAERLREMGALWNTFIMAGELDTFWSLARCHVRREAMLLEEYARTGDESRLPAIYEQLGDANFSAQVLEKASGLDVVEMTDSGWCDWGTPERVLSSLEGTAAFDPLLRRIVAGQRLHGRTIELAA